MHATDERKTVGAVFVMSMMILQTVLDQARQIVADHPK
jgi:hypothetical protein